MLRLPPRARLLTLAVIMSNVAGNALLSAGMKAGGSYMSAALNPAVIAGIALLILWTLARMALLSWADLSYVLPVTALGYVLTAGVSAVFLHEHVSPTRWAASGLIFAGVALAGATAPRTTRENSAK